MKTMTSTRVEYLQRTGLYSTAPRRALANAVIVEGFFAVMWFSWGGQGRAGAWESPVPIIGALLAALIGATGILMAYRARHESSPLAEPEARTRYRIIVATEFGSIAAGAAILEAIGHAAFLAAWVCLVVGAHFVPLGRMFAGIRLRGLAVAVLLVGVGAAIMGITTPVSPSSVAGLGAGACLLVHATSLLTRTRRRRDDARPEPA